MSLIDEIKKLRGLEQQATCGKWETDENEGGHEIRMGKAITSRGHYPSHCVIEYEHGCFDADTEAAIKQSSEAEANAYLISALRNLAPAMLEVLGCFGVGDADTIYRIRRMLERGFIDPTALRGYTREDRIDMLNCLNRYQNVASLMEQEREG